MAVQNVISGKIDTVGQEAQYDACVKKLLSEKIILAWILKECVSEFRQYSISRIMKECIEGEPGIAVTAVDQDELDRAEDPDDADRVIEGVNTEDASVREGKIYYDIRFSAVVPDTREPVQLIINIEAQKSDKTPYPILKRAIYYVSRMISAQKNTVFTRSHYEKIRKVYSIWIQMNVGREKANTITKYRISEEQVVGRVSERESDYDLLTVMMLRLGPAESAADRSILRLLDVLLSTRARPEEKKVILEQEFDIPMSASISKEANAMSNLGEGLREQILEEVIEEVTEQLKDQITEQVREQVTEQVREQVTEQVREQVTEQVTERVQTETRTEIQIKTVFNLMRSLKLSAEEAISAMGVPDEDRQPLLEVVGRKLAVK